MGANGSSKRRAILPLLAWKKNSRGLDPERGGLSLNRARPGRNPSQRAESVEASSGGNRARILFAGLRTRAVCFFFQGFGGCVRTWCSPKKNSIAGRRFFGPIVMPQVKFQKEGFFQKTSRARQNGGAGARQTGEAARGGGLIKNKMVFSV